MLSVDEAIVSRRSVRAFKADEVPKATVAEILEVAKRSPSGTNTQPWRVHVFTGAAKDRLINMVQNAFWSDSHEHTQDRLHYMETWRDPYLARRRKVGWDLYGLAGIKKGEREKTREFHARNFRFFGAPVGLLFSVDNDMGWMTWLDYGMFIQSICIAARGRGLHTCPQAAWGTYHALLKDYLQLPYKQMIHCGLSLGYEDTDAAVNGLETAREPLHEFATFYED